MATASAGRSRSWPAQDAPWSGPRTSTRSSHATTRSRRSCRSGAMRCAAYGRSPVRASVAESLRILGIGDAKSRHFARWATRLAERGHEVHVASGRVNPREGELDGLHVHQYQDLDALLRVPLVRRFRMTPALAGLARDVRPDVVHSHYLLPYGYWTARAGLQPLVVSPKVRSGRGWRLPPSAPGRTSSTRRRSRTRPSGSGPTARSSTGSSGTPAS